MDCGLKKGYGGENGELTSMTSSCRCRKPEAKDNEDARAGRHRTGGKGR